MGLKVVLITTGQPSINPRIVKEADALFAAGYEVIMLYCFWIEWASNADIRLLKEKAWRSILIGGSRVEDRGSFLYTRLRLKIIKALNKKLGNKFKLAEKAQARCYNELLTASKRIKADWYIGHNLGALAVCCAAAEYNKAKCGFDFEDYHREESENMPLYERRRIIYLEKKYISHLNYCSTASPMITEKFRQNFPSFNKPVITILNCFPLNQQPAFREKRFNDNTLQLFWFSQTVGKNRGLEIVIKVLNKLRDPLIYLTLAGKWNVDFEDYLLQKAGNINKNIIRAGIIEAEKLPEFASFFDVGLAVELNTPVNRDLCLTNKIFTYLMAGNAIICSATSMQQQFNKKYNLGKIFTINNEDELTSKILFYKNKNVIEAQRSKNYTLAKHELNWENESKKLLEVIN